MTKASPVGGAVVGIFDRDCNIERTRFRDPSLPDPIRDLRRRRHVERLHRLGPRAIDELPLDIGAERHCLTAIEDNLE